MKKETREVFVANDGRIFLDENEAKKHDMKTDFRKTFRIQYNPDLNETGRLMNTGYLVVDASWGHELWAEHWCYISYKSRVAFIQGTAPTINWSLTKIKPEEVEEEKILEIIKK